MKNLLITTVESSNISKALQISEERAMAMSDKIAEAIDDMIESREKDSDSARITDLAKLAIDKIQPQNANELFWIGVKFGEIVEQNSTHSAMHAMLEAIKPSESDLARSILRSTDPGA